MTPRQKAIILHDKMFVNSKSIGGAFTDWELAKQCALIAVDEIIEFGNQQGIREPMMYWQEVKQKIEAL
jgi:hypothetical protein